MFYKNTKSEVTKEGVWDEKSCVRRVGGYDIDTTNLPADYKVLPKGAPLAFVSATGKVALVKTAVVYENASSSATSLKVKKGHALIVGDTIAGSAISAITVGNDYDTLTVAALSAAKKANDIVTDANASNVIGLNYASVKIDDAPSCTPTLQAYEIEEDSLPYAINDTIKTALTVRHAFKI